MVFRIRIQGSVLVPTTITYVAIAIPNCSRSPNTYSFQSSTVALKTCPGGNEGMDCVSGAYNHWAACAGRAALRSEPLQGPHALARCGSPCLVLLVTGMKDRRRGHQASWKLLATKQFTKDFAKSQHLQFWCSFWNRVFLKQGVGRHRNNSLCLKNYLGKTCTF